MLRIVTEETKEKQRLARIKFMSNPDNAEWWRSFFRSKEYRQNQSATMIQVLDAPEVRKRISEGTKKGLTPEAIAKGTAKKMGRVVSEEHKRKTSNSLKGYRSFRFNKGNKRGVKLGYKCSPEHIEKVRQNTLAQWRDPVKCERILKAMMKSPNKMELRFLKILNDNFPDEWAFVGDGTLIIDRLCPDFVNINGKKLIIEFFGEYWHKPQDIAIRSKIFKRFGYKTLFVWSEELKKEDVLITKIGDWINA